MIGGRLTTPVTNRPIVPESKVRWLGSLDGWDYCEHGGREFVVYQAATPDAGAYTKQPGEILIGKRVTEVFDGSTFEHNLHFRALPIAVGTHAKLAAAQADRKARLDRKSESRLLDALGTHPLLARRGDAVLPIPDVSADRLDAALLEAPDEESAEALLKVSRKPPAAVRIPGREPRQGVAAILEVLQAKGVEMRLSEGGTMYATGARHLLDSVRKLVDDAAPLLHAHLLGQPVRCEFRHKDQAPEAVTLLVGGAAACGQHLSGELQP